MDNINDLVNEIANRLRRLGQRVSRLEESEYGAPPTVEGGAVFNESGADVDHRFEGDTDPNLLFLDAGNNRVGIGTASPTGKLDVNGITNIFSDLQVTNNGGSAVTRLTTYRNSPFMGLGIFRSARGTESVPSAILSGDIIGRFGAKGYHSGGAFGGETGFFAFKAAENYTSSAQGSDFTIELTGAGGTSRSEKFRVTNAGGVVVGAPTGGDKGAGTLNATAVYDDNTLLTDWVFDLHYDGRINEQDKHASPNGRLWNIEDTEQFAKDNRHLPTMPGREAWEEGGKRSLGELVTALWETVEQQQLQIFDLNQRIEKLNCNNGGV